MRAFVAIDVDGTLRAKYARFRSSARDVLPYLRWVAPENLHVTLRFLGEIEPRLSEKLHGSLGAVAARIAPFEFSVGEPVGFGSRSAPRTLGFELLAPDRLEQLAREVESAVRDAGVPAERRRWRAHLTVARNPRTRRLRDWREFLGASGLPGLCSPVESLTLYSSRLQPTGPVYTVEWSLPLAAC